MRNTSRIIPIRPLVLAPARLGRQRHMPSEVIRARAGFALRHLALAGASHPIWLNAPLFSRHQSSLSAAVRHAA